MFPTTDTTSPSSPAAEAARPGRRRIPKRAPRGARVLAVDDEAAIRELYRIQLESAGYEVSTAASAREALALLHEQAFDVVLSDISMPDMDGIGLLDRIHREHPDLPVILATGCPSMETAIQAVELHAIRYLTKPVRGPDLVDAVDGCANLRRLALVERSAVRLGSASESSTECPPALERDFERAFETLRLVYQPIVSWSGQQVFAWEALMRHDVPELLPPPRFIDVAEDLGRLRAVGRRVRELAALAVPTLPPDAALFVNLHPSDLQDDELFSRTSPLARVADRVVLEITERQHLEEILDLDERIRTLRDLGFRIAVDDLGAGYSSLSSFAELAPDLVKLDMSLVREVHLHPAKHRLVASLIEICGELGVDLVAEGIETEAERDHLAGLGCDLMQGFFFGRPSAQPEIPALAVPAARSA